MNFFSKKDKKSVIKPTAHKTIHAEINDISYTIKTTNRTKKILISIDTNGQLTVLKSPFVSIEKVKKIIEQKYEWIIDKIQKQKSKPRKILSIYNEKDFKENKEKARSLIKERLDYFNQFYNYNINNVYIRNPKSRWGSCSSKNNLNFSYKLFLLPPELCDYIIVHELCHLQEMNHGKNFWSLVEKTIPDYKNLIKELKKY